MIDANYPMVEYAKGVWLYDTEGRAYLDSSSGAMTANIGHGVPDIAEGNSTTAQRIALMDRYPRHFGVSTVHMQMADREFIGQE